HRTNPSPPTNRSDPGSAGPVPDVLEPEPLPPEGQSNHPPKVLSDRARAMGPGNATGRLRADAACAGKAGGEGGRSLPDDRPNARKSAPRPVTVSGRSGEEAGAVSSYL